MQYESRDSASKRFHNVSPKAYVVQIFARKDLKMRV